MQDLVMANVATQNKGLIARSLFLSRILYFGNRTYSYFYWFFAAYWLVSYGMSYWVPPTPTMFMIMFMPGVLQAILAMMVALRASTLLQNSQLHFVGIRKELFINLLAMCVLFSLPVFDPKNAENLIAIKLLSFMYVSIGMFLMLWLYSLQVLSMLVLVLSVPLVIFLIAKFGATLVVPIWSVLAWGYLAYWLSRSPLQRMFKFENFSNFFDYLIERLKLVKYRTLMTRVLNKEHVILMGEGDGHMNRIFYAQAFSLIFTCLYLLLMQNSKELCLWMILMHMGGSKVRMKLGQSHMKLWLFNDGDRLHQFRVTENLSFRLYAYTFITALMMLVIWIFSNPSLALHGVICLCLVQLFVIAADYYGGFILKIGNPVLLVSLLLKMTFMFALVFIHLDYVWYLVIAAVIISLGAIFRQEAKKRFVSANFTLRAS
ncbi:hypothetical protein GCM10011613_35480 [Cellvibrio zantedeschiae]|uniref:ABC transporter permease n=1 Tax=Cellvibrio zantedeschiae TaxID=1237077 RepID=A0ABQ3BAM0_9GAMM|nr:hypothetical protein [Cellvibrio zantedeschiae]GGY87191.1 hypothetical protein GCM10011613_35480 [Cellvibrio zantedeschiae]